MLSIKKLFAVIIAQYLRFSYELLKNDCVFHTKKDAAPCRANVVQCRPDVNPVPYGEMLSLNVTPDDARIDLDLAVEVASFFGLTGKEANIEIEKMLSIIRGQWRSIASECGLSREAQNEMAEAFALSGGR